MLYNETLDQAESNAVSVRIFTTIDAYDTMYKWCVEQNTGNKFASDIYADGNFYFDTGVNGGHGTFYFSNADDALLFRLRWSCELR